LRADAFGHLGGIHRHAVASAADKTVGAVDRDDNLSLLSVVLLGGRNQRGFDALEDDLFVDILIAVDRVDDTKQFVGVHSS